MLYFLSAHGVSDIKFPEPPADGDPIALLIVVVVLAAFAIFTMINKRKKANAAAADAGEEAPAVKAAPTAPGSAGTLKLYNVDPRTAAMLMAIVADKLGKPLNELRFISIKEVE